MTSRILTRAGARRCAAGALTLSLGATLLVAGGQTAMAAEPSHAVSTAAASATATTDAVSVSVDADGTVRYRMTEALFRSAQRVMLRVGGGYAGETYKGVAYYSRVSIADGVATVTATRKAAFGQRVEVQRVAGRPGGGYNASTASTVASTVMYGAAPTLQVVGGRTLKVTMPRALFESAHKVRVTVDGGYVGSTVKGVSYYMGHRRQGDTVALQRTLKYAPDETLEMTVDGTVIAHVDLAGPGPQLTVEKASSSLTVIPRGDAEADRKRENRWFRHSVLEPAGRYVTAGQKITVTPAEGASGLKVAIGQYGPHTGINGGASKALSYVSVPGDRPLTITAPIDGLVSLVNTSAAATRVSVSGGVAVPSFVLGETTEAQFKSDLAAFPESPLTVVEGRRLVAAFQRRFLVPRLAGVTVGRVQSWDDAVARIDRTYGLSVSETGLNRKSLARVFMANPDTGAGGASATQDHVTFQVNGGVANQVLTQAIDNQWGLWHEIGHTYQTPQYRWSGMTEVTVNIASHSVLEGFGVSGPPSHQPEVDEFMALPEEQRDFNTAKKIQLRMFEQLFDQYGIGFYAKLSRLYRERVDAGTLKVSGTVAMQQYFMVTAGEASGHNLTAFFSKWGLKPDAETKAALAKYPN
ncbi:hypothetical protein LK09_09715 [Microbacterium mangrovi]|uniref:Peptidase M60 domain-containing protein n=1 Tax=Microbacterium mangrovi TaxID=1348253 RepID=A0A0B2A848_9MICO|nr:M60 family metallopeptidase [Microbacterium mangrovi]KHK97771.1 hypothetical protein LK09_09715 [Microbacterium mangrovi]